MVEAGERLVFPSSERVERDKSDHRELRFSLLFFIDLRFFDTLFTNIAESEGDESRRFYCLERHDMFKDLENNGHE